MQLQRYLPCRKNPHLHLLRLSQKARCSFFDEQFLTPEAEKSHRIIGQVFDTYWLIQYGENLYIIDQHAAHEKVLFERMMKNYRKRTSPPRW